MFDPAVEGVFDAKLGAKAMNARDRADKATLDDKRIDTREGFDFKAWDLKYTLA